MTGNTMTHVRNHLFSRNHAEADHWKGSVDDMRLYRAFGILTHEVGQVSIFERCIECREMTWIADFDKPGLHYWFERDSGKRAKEIEMLIDTLRPVADHDRDYRGFHNYKVTETHGLVEHRGVAYWIEGAIISTTFDKTKQAYRVYMYARCGYCNEWHSLHAEMVGAVYQIVDTDDPDFYRYQHLDGTDDFALRHSAEDMATMIDYVITTYLTDKYSLAVYAQVHHSAVDFVAERVRVLTGSEPDHDEVEATKPDNHVEPDSVVYGKAVYHDLTSHVGQMIVGEYFRHRNVAFWKDQVDDDHPILYATHLLARCGTCGEWVDLDQFEITNVHGGQYRLAADSLLEQPILPVETDSVRSMIDWIVSEYLSSRSMHVLFPDIDRLSTSNIDMMRDAAQAQSEPRSSLDTRPQYMQSGDTSVAIETIQRVLSFIILGGNESIPRLHPQNWIDDWGKGLRELAWWLERYREVVDRYVDNAIQINISYLKLKRQQATLVEFVNPDRWTLSDIRRVADEQIHEHMPKVLATTAKADDEVSS